MIATTLVLVRVKIDVMALATTLVAVHASILVSIRVAVIVAMDVWIIAQMGVQRDVAHRAMGVVPIQPHLLKVTQSKL